MHSTFLISDVLKIIVPLLDSDPQGCGSSISICLSIPEDTFEKKQLPLKPVVSVTSTVQAPKYIIELNPIRNVKIWCAESYMHCVCLMSHSV